MKFSDIIGQEDVKNRLRCLVRENRVPHALLLSGPEGVGKLPLALAFAEYLQCPDRSDMEPCGQCPSCRQMELLQHPDVHLAFPIVNQRKSGETSVCDDFVQEFRDFARQRRYFSMDDWMMQLTQDNKQGQIYAQESDEMLRKLSLKSYESEYKVMLIWLPEKMNVTGANKLLKLLEEPPEKTVFLLVSNHPEQLLQTIRSRVQEIPVPALTEQELSRALDDLDDDFSAADRMAYAHMAQGSYLQLLRLYDNDQVAAFNLQQFIQLMRWAWMVAHKKDYNSLREMKQWAEQMGKELTRERQKSFLQNCQRLVRENFIYNLQQPAINYMSPAEQEFSQNFARFIGVLNVEDMMALFARGEREIEQNVNGRMVFFDIAVQLIILIKRQ